jgi:hypothetical protein
VATAAAARTSRLTAIGQIGVPGMGAGVPDLGSNGAADAASTNS